MVIKVSSVWLIDPVSVMFVQYGPTTALHQSNILIKPDKAVDQEWPEWGGCIWSFRDSPLISISDRHLHHFSVSQTSFVLTASTEAMFQALRCMTAGAASSLCSRTSWFTDRAHKSYRDHDPVCRSDWFKYNPLTQEVWIHLCSVWYPGREPEWTLVTGCLVDRNWLIATPGTESKVEDRSEIHIYFTLWPKFHTYSSF